MCPAAPLHILCSPGQKLNFMGNEIAHSEEWDESGSWTGACSRPHAPRRPPGPPEVKLDGNVRLVEQAADGIGVINESFEAIVETARTTPSQLFMH